MLSTALKTDQIASTPKFISTFRAIGDIERMFIHIIL